MDLNANQTIIGLLSSTASCPEDVASPGVYAFLYLSVAAVVFITTCGNLLVIISVCHFKQFHTPTNFVILSLAVSDFLVGAFVMPFHFVMLIESCWLFGAMFCVLFYFVLYNLTFISVYNVSLIALDRYIALSNPFFYSSKASANMIFTTTVLIWVVSVFYNFALLYVNGNFTDFKVCDGVCLPALGPVSGIFDLTVVFILPCAIMMVLYVKIFAIARRHAIAIRANIKEIRRSDLKNNASMRSERKAAKALGILVAVFLFCLAPYYTCSIINGFVSELLDTLIIATLTLFYLNSTFNPVIYAFFHPSFRKSMILILTCRILSKDSSTMNVLLKAN